LSKSPSTCVLGGAGEPSHRWMTPLATDARMTEPPYTRRSTPSSGTRRPASATRSWFDVRELRSSGGGSTSRRRPSASKRVIVSMLRVSVGGDDRTTPNRSGEIVDSPPRSNQRATPLRLWCSVARIASASSHRWKYASEGFAMKENDVASANRIRKRIRRGVRRSRKRTPAGGKTNGGGMYMTKDVFGFF